MYKSVLYVYNYWINYLSIANYLKLKSLTASTYKYSLSIFVTVFREEGGGSVKLGACPGPHVL